MKITKLRIRNALQRAHDLLESGWCREFFAQDIDYKSVSAVSESACRFCADGALKRATQHSGSAVYLKARKAILSAIDDPCLIYWNDYQPDVKPVLAAFRRAIKLCK